MALENPQLGIDKYAGVSSDTLKELSEIDGLHPDIVRGIHTFHLREGEAKKILEEARALTSPLVPDGIDPLK